MRRIGLATGTLTDYEIEYVETEIVKTVRPLLVGRQIMPIRTLPHAGFKKYTFYNETDMSQATIDMTGEPDSKDRVVLEETSVDVPVLHKEYTLHWRDVLMRREGGQDLNTQHAENAGRQVAEEEDRLILSGETDNWKALGLKGLLTSCSASSPTMRANSGDWDTPGNIIPAITTAKAALRGQGHYGPYKLVMPGAVYARLEKIETYGGKWYFQLVGELIGGIENILISDSLYPTDDTAQDSVLMLDVTPGNFELVVGQDLTNHLAQLPNMNYYGRVYEVVVPVIKRPYAIYEMYEVLT